MTNTVSTLWNSVSGAYSGAFDGAVGIVIVILGVVGVASVVKWLFRKK